MLELLGSRGRRLIGVVGIEGLAVAQRVILSVVHCCCVQVAISDELAPTESWQNEGSVAGQAQAMQNQQSKMIQGQRLLDWLKDASMILVHKAGSQKVVMLQSARTVWMKLFLASVAFSRLSTIVA